MGFTFTASGTNTTTTSATGSRKSMGLLLVFFREDQSTKTNLLSSLSSACSTTRFIKRTNSSGLLTKAQSTISICALFVFLTLLLFTLSTFEPTIPVNPAPITAPRRFLSDNRNYRPFSSYKFFLNIWNNNPKSEPPITSDRKRLPSFALQGMGTLYRRGTKAMNDLVVGHVVEDVTEDELRLSLRVLHRSGVTAKADIVFVFASSLLASKFDSVIEEENESFLKLVHAHKESNFTSKSSIFSFDVNHFVKRGKKEMGEPLWGKRIRGNYSINSVEGDSEQPQLSYGSVLGFEANELDPENSLAGFLDNVPMSLRRWACYPMLLGRVRRNFKHVMLVDLKTSLLVSDPLGRVRSQSPESVYVWWKQGSSSSKHGKRNPGKTQSNGVVNSGILMGGARGVRRLSNAMLTEIVRAALQHKKNPVTETGILSQLVGNEHVTKNINMMRLSESIPETSSAAGWQDHAMIFQRGNSNHDLNSIIMKQICAHEVDSSLYRDC